MSAVANAGEHRLNTGLGVELWPTPEGGGHGYGLLAYQRDDVLGSADLDLRFNTDTLQVTLRDAKLNEFVYFGGYLKAQVQFGGLLVDYYRQGLLDPQLGFTAGYVQAAGFTELRAASNYIQLELGVRRWAFGRLPTTSPALILPADMWVLEPRLRWTYWNLGFDPATVEPHRHYLRVEGFAAGAELGADLRDQNRAWGAIDPSDFATPDTRNTASGTPMMLRAWWRGGVGLWEGGRLQGMNYVALGRDEDDITRVRLGGVNPYVVQLSGLPWAAFMTTNFVSGHVSLHQKILENSEIGVMADAVTFSQAEAERTSAGAPFTFDAGHVGVGVFGDLRFGDWQVDARVGYALPNAYLTSAPHLGLWVGVGKRIF